MTYTKLFTGSTSNGKCVVSNGGITIPASGSCDLKFYFHSRGADSGENKWPPAIVYPSPLHDGDIIQTIILSAK